MTVAVLIALAFTAGIAAGLAVHRARRPQALPVNGAERILFPFVGAALSERALEACLRLARVERATLVPAYLLSVPMALHLDAPLPSACGSAFELLETIEQRATAVGVPVDARIGRGRNRRHAMRQLMSNERFDRIVVPPATRASRPTTSPGCSTTRRARWSCSSPRATGPACRDTRRRWWPAARTAPRPRPPRWPSRRPPAGPGCATTPTMS
jgi:hypothetical protein